MEKKYCVRYRTGIQAMEFGYGWDIILTDAYSPTDIGVRAFEHFEGAVSNIPDYGRPPRLRYVGF